MTTFSLAKADKYATFTLTKEGRVYETRIDDAFIKEFAIFDKDTLLELLGDFVETKAECKITATADYGVRVEIPYEQNKRQRFFTITMKGEEYFILLRKAELEQKLQKTEAELSTKRVIIRPGSEKLLEGRNIHFIDIKDIKFKSDGVLDLLKAFLMQVFEPTCPTIEAVDRFLRTEEYNIFMTWLTYRSYEKGLHYLTTTGVANIKNDTIDKATGRVYFYSEPGSKTWFDHTVSRGDVCNGFIPTTEGMVCMNTTEKAKA
jgi:hypothetical protein